MTRTPAQVRHLIFLAHLWVCAPFLIVWLYVPEVRREIPVESLGKLMVAVPAICLYLLVRTALAFRPPAWLNWEYVYPPVDVALVSLLIWLGNRDPLSNVALLYLLPVAEAAGTLKVRWAAAVAFFAFVGVALATHGLQTDEPFNTWFRYFLLLILASLITSLGAAAAKLREQLGVARDRNRIALEMHDGVQGHLITAASQLELAQHLLRPNPDRASEVLGETREGVRQAADELRFLVQRLRAPSLAQGFLPSLKQYAHHFCSRNGLDLTFEVLGEEAALGPERENALFRIAQEALSNIVRHARASSVRLELRFEPGRVRLTVEDDGVGFEAGRVPEDGSHAGLESMSQRAREAGGSASISRREEGGTRVVAEVGGAAL